jgi:hypothetical protein
MMKHKRKRIPIAKKEVKEDAIKIKIEGKRFKRDDVVVDKRRPWSWD